MNEEKKQGKKIEVDEDKLKKILESNEALVADNKKQAERLDVLEKISSTQRMKEAKEDLKGKKLPEGHCKILRGKVVVGWMGVNEKGSKAIQRFVYNNNVKVGEEFIGHYKVLDGEDIVCEMSEFTNSLELEKYDVLDTKDDHFIIRFHNPKLPQEYKLKIKFHNA